MYVLDTWANMKATVTDPKVTENTNTSTNN